MATPINDYVTAMVSPKGLIEHPLLPNIGQRPKPNALAPINNGEPNLNQQPSRQSRHGKVAMSVDWGDISRREKNNPLARAISQEQK